MKSTLFKGSNFKPVKRKMVRLNNSGILFCEVHSSILIGWLWEAFCKLDEPTALHVKDGNVAWFCK